jgi:hypothetical protein
VGDLIDPVTEIPLAEKAPTGGDYRIRIISDLHPNFYAESGMFSIMMKINPNVFKERIKLLRPIPVFPGPGCPMCGEVQLSDLLEIIKTTPEAHVVELWHAGRSLGKLVEAGAAGRRLASRRIDFGNSFLQLKKGGSGFELRIFDAQGKLLHTQAVELNYKAN